MQFVKIVLLVTAAVAIALLLAELTLRLVVPASSGAVYAYTTKTPRYKVMLPNAEAVIFGVPLRTNDLGFRDDQQAVPEKRPGEYRVAVIGDSFTVSAGVPFDEIFTSLLERHLRTPPLSLDARVLNLGVAGYNVVQYALVLEEVALGLAPDAVVVTVFVPNDFEMTSYDASARMAASGESHRRPGFRDLLIRRVFLPRLLFVYSWLAGEKSRLGITAPDSKDGWQANSEALGRLGRVAESASIPLLVALLPANASFARQAPHHEQVLEACHEQGVRCVDLLPDFLHDTRGPHEFSLNIADRHPNAAYNALVADALARAMREHRAESGEPPRR